MTVETPGPARPLDALTPRERQTLGLVLRGHSSVEIAAMVYVNPAAITFRLDRIHEKLGIKRRFRSLAPLFAWAIENGHLEVRVVA